MQNIQSEPSRENLLLKNAAEELINASKQSSKLSEKLITLIGNHFLNVEDRIHRFSRSIQNIDLKDLLSSDQIRINLLLDQGLNIEKDLVFYSDWIEIMENSHIEEKYIKLQGASESIKKWLSVTRAFVDALKAINSSQNILNR